MSILERAADGRFVAQTFWDKYPTGRKHCGDCKRWRHVVDFSVATWADDAKTIPHKLVSYCRACVAEKQRQRTGHQLRRVFDGQVGTDHWRQRRLAKKRLRYRCLRNDPVWVEARRSYYRRLNRAKAYAYWAPPPTSDPQLSKKTSGGESFDAKKFACYLERWIKELPDPDTGVSSNYLNGYPLDDNDGRRIRAWKNGENANVLLATADRWCIRFDLPLWEIEEEAAKMAA